jgi:hypothetical protein
MPIWRPVRSRQRQSRLRSELPRRWRASAPRSSRFEFDNGPSRSSVAWRTGHHAKSYRPSSPASAGRPRRSFGPPCGERVGAVRLPSASLKSTLAGISEPDLGLAAEPKIVHSPVQLVAQHPRPRPAGLHLQIEPASVRHEIRALPGFSALIVRSVKRSATIYFSHRPWFSPCLLSGLKRMSTDTDGESIGNSRRFLRFFG